MHRISMLANLSGTVIFWRTVTGELKYLNVQFDTKVQERVSSHRTLKYG